MRGCKTHNEIKPAACRAHMSSFAGYLITRVTLCLTTHALSTLELFTFLALGDGRGGPQGAHLPFWDWRGRAVSTIGGCVFRPHTKQAAASAFGMHVPSAHGSATPILYIIHNPLFLCRLFARRPSYLDPHLFYPPALRCLQLPIAFVLPRKLHLNIKAGAAADPPTDPPTNATDPLSAVGARSCPIHTHSGVLPFVSCNVTAAAARLHLALCSRLMRAPI
jgi:hypothetical protein